MANYNTEFSTILSILAEQEEEWLKRHLFFKDLVDPNGMVKPDGHYDATGPTSSEAKLWERCMLDAGEDCWEFEWSIHDEGGRKYVWFRSDDCRASPYQLCCVVHAFLKAMRPEGNDEFVLTWSETCDKLRADAFGGGTMVVTKEGVGTCAGDEQYKLAKHSVTNPWGDE